MTEATKLSVNLCSSCGKNPVYPGEEECHACLGIDRPGKIEPDDSYIGSEEWKEEVRYWWPKLFPKAPSTPDSPSELIAKTTTA